MTILSTIYLPYIRMFTGSMDYIPATMRNANKYNFRQIWDYPMGWGTRPMQWLYLLF